MNKKAIIGLAAGALFSVGTLFTNNQTVDAAKMQTIRKAYIYNKRGRRTRSYIKRHQIISTSRTRRIHGRKFWQLSRNRFIVYSNLRKMPKQNRIYEPKAVKNFNVNLDTIKTAPDAKSAVANASSMPAGTKYQWMGKRNTPSTTKSSDMNEYCDLKIIFPDKSTSELVIVVNYYGSDSIKLPASYTQDSIAKAVSDPSSLAKGAKEGKENNFFLPESVSDDKEKVNILNLTAAQKQEISEFTLKLINQIHNQLGVPEWHYTAEAQQVADDVANEYQTNKRGIQDGDHYVDGIVRAADKNGLDVDGINQLEDMYGDTFGKPKTMTDLKREAYDGIRSFMFNGDEYDHCADISCCHDDDEWNEFLTEAPFAVSYSYVGGWNSVHYIRIPSNVR